MRLPFCFEGPAPVANGDPELSPGSRRSASEGETLGGGGDGIDREAVAEQVKSFLDIHPRALHHPILRTDLFIPFAMGPP